MLQLLLNLLKMRYFAYFFIHTHLLKVTGHLISSSTNLKCPRPSQAMLLALLSKCPALPTRGLSHHTPPHPTPTLLLFTRSGAPTPNRTPMHRSVHLLLKDGRFWLLVLVLKYWCYNQRSKFQTLPP